MQHDQKSFIERSLANCTSNVIPSSFRVSFGIQPSVTGPQLRVVVTINVLAAAVLVLRA